jgi:hypothetical protein
VFEEEEKTALKNPNLRISDAHENTNISCKCSYSSEKIPFWQLNFATINLSIFSNTESAFVF